ncbi:MAG: DUF1223 domain-containing protein [Cyclobacteriaceae bacterium]
MRSFLLCSIALTFLSAQSQDFESFAVVELFTSQGCSSCPRADQNLSELIKTSEKNGDNVMALSFHVDYWDRLGWKDPYSSAQFTERQKKYASTLRSSNIYTPQMIVNGKVEFVGSQQSKLETEVKKALNHAPETALKLVETELKQGNLRVKYEVVGKVGTKLKLNLAIVQKDIETAVPKGENRGRTLRHDNVVRAFQSIPINKAGLISLSIEVLEGIDFTNSSLIGYVQEGSHESVIAANNAPLSGLK